jgi:hypothetical protein
MHVLYIGTVPFVMDVVSEKNTSCMHFVWFLLQVCSIEQELNSLQKLNHENLVQYISMKYVQEKGCLVIYVLQVSQLWLDMCRTLC